MRLVSVNATKEERDFNNPFRRPSGMQVVMQSRSKMCGCFSKAGRTVNNKASSGDNSLIFF